MASDYRVRERPLKAETVWRLEAGDLVRAVGTAEMRWPLSNLTALTLTRQPNRYGPDLRLAQLRFGRRRAAFSSQGWEAVGRRHDQSAAFGAFVRALGAQASALAPSARFRMGGRGSAPVVLYWVAALLSAALIVLLAMALSAHQIILGLEFGARLLFVLIMLFVAAPWLPGPEAGAFDPLAIPDDLAPRA